MALDVATEYQRRGIESMLLQAAESALVARGVSVVVVNSRNHRGGAHAFYGRNGYDFTARSYKKAVGTAVTHGAGSG